MKGCMFMHLNKMCMHWHPETDIDTNSHDTMLCESTRCQIFVANADRIIPARVSTVPKIHIFQLPSGILYLQELEITQGMLQYHDTMKTFCF